MLHTLLHLSKHRNLYGIDYNNRVCTLSVSPAIIVVDAAVYRWLVHSIYSFLEKGSHLQLHFVTVYHGF